MLRYMLLLSGPLLLAGGVSAQQPGHRHDSTRAIGREMMMEQVRAADARLDRLVGDMNGSAGARKVEAMAAVINEMVAQRKQMRAHMMQMMERMHPGGMRDRRRQMPSDTVRVHDHDST